jgi:hypothetical protein
LNPDLKRKILHALVGQIIVTQDGLKLGVYAGLDQIKKGEAKASPDLLPHFRNYFVPSSFKHLNGGPTKNRPSLSRSCSKARHGQFIM